MSPIRVKFMAAAVTGPDVRVWRRQLPAAAPRLGDCEFLFDADESRYDWLAVYERFPSRSGGRSLDWIESLGCPSQHTIFVTAEPSAVKVYGRGFLDQFGYVLTGQEDWAITHPGVIRSQPALRWFYGVGHDSLRDYDALAAADPPAKTDLISTVCSSKQQKHTLHNDRYRFVRKLKELVPELEVFGHGVRRIDDKAEALDPYKYHLAIENHVSPHHWTEKLSDSFLGYTLPFYFGCPNATDYFPEESFVPIDIFDFDAAAARVREVLHDDAWEQRLPAIRDARRRVLEDYNLFAVLAREIEARHAPEAPRDADATIIDRHAARNKSLANRLAFLREKLRVKHRVRRAHAALRK